MPNDAVKPIAQFMEGGPLSASQMNQVVQGLLRRITGDGKTLRARTFPGGQVIFEAIPQAGLITPVAHRATFVAEFDDYITAKLIIGKPGATTGGGVEVKVRKPYGLMRSVYEPHADFTHVGVTTRKYMVGQDEEEEQTIQPAYDAYGADQEITIAEGRQGGEWIQIGGAWEMCRYHEVNEYARVWGLTC